ncbi:MAG: DUF1565 domain-containing protein [Deltaproteobacteria bacterium]|nr:DUF1565 domain-containing protein [Deltaproteobacteria bacterium]
MDKVHQHAPGPSFGRAGAGLMVLLFTTNALARTYIVAPNGNDANAGTVSEPWRTIAKANVTLQPGDTVQIRDGWYSEVIKPARSGEAGKKITYENFADELPKVTGNSALDDVADLRATAYIVIKGLHMVHAQRSTPGQSFVVAILYEDAHHNEILDCSISSPDKIPLMTKREDVVYRETGIVVASGAHHNLVQGNTIENMTKIGIHLSKAPRFTRVIRNRIIGPYQDCIHHGSGKGVLVGTLIEGNLLGGSVISDGVQFNANYDATDPKTDTSNRGTIIRNNIIFNNAENGIDLKGTSNIVVEGNIIYGNTGNNDGFGVINNYSLDYADRFGGLGGIMHGAGASSRDVIIRNNIIYDNLGGMTATDPGWMVYNNTIVGNDRDYDGPHSTYRETRKPYFVGMPVGPASVVKNNIVGDHPLGEMKASGPVNIEHNFYYNTYRETHLIHYKDTHDWSEIDLEPWRLLVKGDYHANIGDPQFVKVPSRPVGDSSAFDFALKASSPCVDAGAFLTSVVTSGAGVNIPVKDSRYFYDGYGVALGDAVQIEGQTATSRIVSVDYVKHILVVENALTWVTGQGVSLAYHGRAPDVGAYEMVSATQAPDSGTAPATDSGTAPATDSATAPATDSATAPATDSAMSQSSRGELDGGCNCNIAKPQVSRSLWLFCGILLLGCVRNQSTRRRPEAAKDKPQGGPL